MASAASCVQATNLAMTQVCGGVGHLAGAHWRTFTFTYANTYATGGGDPCDLTSYFPNAIIAVVLPNLDDTFHVMPYFDQTAKKMKAYKQKSDDTFEELGGVDASTYTFKFSVLGY